MKTIIHLEYLADYPQYIETVAGWMHKQWGHETPEITQSDRIARVRASAVRAQIPLVFLAMWHSQPIGTASIVISDMSVRPELTPWLASVYVEPEWRCKGVGRQLVVRAMHDASKLNVEELYLFTPDRQSFYAKLGWIERETCQYRGHDNLLMTHNLHNIPEIQRPNKTGGEESNGY